MITYYIDFVSRRDGRCTSIRWWRGELAHLTGIGVVGTGLRRNVGGELCIGREGVYFDEGLFPFLAHVRFARLWWTRW